MEKQPERGEGMTDVLDDSPSTLDRFSAPLYTLAEAARAKAVSDVMVHLPGH